MFTLAHLSHVLLGSEDQFKVHYPLGELLEQTAVRVNVNRLEEDGTLLGIELCGLCRVLWMWSHTRDTCWCFTVLYTPPLDSRAVW